MRQKTKVINLPKLYAISLFIALAAFILDIMVTNRSTNYKLSLILSIVFGLIEATPFVIGTNKSFKNKNTNWLVMNILTFLIIIGWAVWCVAFVYGFKDLNFSIPA